MLVQSQLSPNAESQRLVKSMQSRLVWLPMNGQSGNVMDDKTIGADFGNTSIFTFNQNTVGLEADLRKHGALGVEWSAKPGWYSPRGTASVLGQGDGAGGSAARMNDVTASYQAMHDFMRLDTLDNLGGMLVMFDYINTGAPNPTEYVHTYGRYAPSAGQPGWSISTGLSGGEIFVSGNLHTVTPTSFSATTTDVAADERVRVGVYFDVMNDAITSYVFDEAGSYSSVQVDVTEPTLWCGQSDSTIHSNVSGLTILGGGGSTPAGGLGTNFAPAIRNMQYIRFEYDASGIWQQLVEDTFTHVIDLPPSFEGI